MGTPVNQLQFLRFNLSGREIGIDKYKPFTAANEKADYIVDLRASMFKSVLESGYLTVSIPSGQQSSAIKEQSSLGLLFTGSFVFSPGDISTNYFIPSGKLDSVLKDAGYLIANFKSGDFIDSKYDFSDYQINKSGRFTGELRETTEYSVNNLSGNFKAQDHDCEELDFILFTGLYYEGHFSTNIPVIQEDIAEIDFIFFTGSYQG